MELFVWVKGRVSTFLYYRHYYRQAAIWLIKTAPPYTTALNELFPMTLLSEAPYLLCAPSDHWLPAAAENYRHGHYCCCVVIPVLSCQRDKDTMRWTIRSCLCMMTHWQQLFALIDVLLDRSCQKQWPIDLVSLTQQKKLIGTPFNIG